MKTINDILKPNTNFNELLSTLFKSKIESHITHILQRKKLLCEHEALSTFYTEVEDKIDSLAELLMAHGLVTNIIVPQTGEIKDSLSYFENLYKVLERHRTSLNKIPFLVSKLDDLQELVSQTIYRLKFIQS